jgi:hypothetical protein
MIGHVAAETGIPPSTLWREAPEDLATLLVVLRERAAAARRRR